MQNEKGVPFNQDNNNDQNENGLNKELDGLLQEEHLDEAIATKIIQNIIQQFQALKFKERNRAQYTYAYDAFAAEVLDGPKKALTRDYEPSKSFWEFLWDLCNRKSIPKIVIAALVGGIAAYFYVPSAMNAGNAIADILGIAKASWFRDFMSYSFAAVGAGENAMLGAFSMKDMFEQWFGEESDERYFLNGKSNATKGEKVLKKGKTIADTLLAAGPVVASFAMALQGGNFWLSLASALASYGPNYLGVSKFNYAPEPPKTDKQLYFAKARKTIANYIEEQINNFLLLTPEKIFAKINAMKTGIESLNDSNECFAKTFTEILNLSNLDTEEEHILPQKTESAYRRYFRNAVVADSILSPIGYIVAAYQGGSIFWKAHPTVTGLPPALLSILPYLGLSYVSGIQVGTHALSGEKTLADVAYPKFKAFFNYAIPAISIASGGTNFMANLENAKIPGLPDYFNKILSSFMGGVGLVGAPIVNGYYTLKLVDEIATLYAKSCADEPTRRLIYSIIELRKLQATIKNINDSNFDELFAQMYRKHPEISSQLVTIIQNRCTGMEVKGVLDNLSDREAAAAMAEAAGLNYSYVTFAGTKDSEKSPSRFFMGLRYRGKKNINGKDVTPRDEEAASSKKQPLSSQTSNPNGYQTNSMKYASQ